MSRTEKWNTSFDAVNTFVNTNQKYPSTTSKNPSERSLAQWWSRQKFLLNKHKENTNTNLTQQQIESIEGLILKNQALERDGVWNNYYQSIVNQFKLEGKMFTSSPKNTEHQKIVRWWNQQKTFARKFLANPNQPVGGMTQERFDKILALLRIMGHELNNVASATN